jgi:hypothetical protein
MLSMKPPQLLNKYVRGTSRWLVVLRFDFSVGIKSSHAVGVIDSHMPVPWESSLTRVLLTVLVLYAVSQIIIKGEIRYVRYSLLANLAKNILLEQRSLLLVASLSLLRLSSANIAWT